LSIRKNHPNAVAAAGSGGSAAALVSILAAFGIAVPPVAAAWAVAAAPVVFLAIGRKGIRGLVRQVWRGSEGDVVVTHAPEPVESVEVHGDDAEEVEGP
jgi:predicted dinucleotide-binding enzyme